MTRRPPPPRTLEKRAFAVGEALAAGMSLKMLRDPALRGKHWGTRSLLQMPSADSRTEHRARIPAAEYLPLLRVTQGEAFSHLTALRLLGAPIRGEAAVHVSIPHPARAAQGRHVRGHTVMTAFDPVLLDLDGMLFPCVPPALALFQAASSLSFRELVVAADHLILPRRSRTDKRPLAQREALIELANASSVRGISRLRAALQVSRVGAESRMESLQHFELASMGLDMLELQAEIYDRRGSWIGRFDGVDREKRRIMEYDGEQHRTDRRQYLRDIEKLDRARDEGYRILRHHREDFHPGRLARTRFGMCEFLDERPRAVPPALARYFAEPY